MATLVIGGGESTEIPIERDRLVELWNDEQFFWLDLHGVHAEELQLVGEVFGFHPLAIEDAVNFGQRPKADEYDHFIFLVVYGAAPDADDLVEVHCFFSEHFLVTVRKDECPAFTSTQERIARRPPERVHSVTYLYLIADSLVDSFFPLLMDFDDRIDELEESIFHRPDDRQLQQIFAMKRRLVNLRRVVAPQRDLFTSVVSGVIEIPGMTEAAEHYFRDVYDHLIRLTDTIDSYRDLLSSAMDVYLSTVSNRLNGVTKQLAAVATIFLPLTFITGFYGQNFGWMVRHVGGLTSFIVLGIGAQLMAFAALIVFFKKRGWF